MYDSQLIKTLTSFWGHDGGRDPDPTRTIVLPPVLPRWAARGQKTRAEKLILAVNVVLGRHDRVGGGGCRAAGPASQNGL